MKPESEELEEQEPETVVKVDGDGPGCGWVIITLIVCVTIYAVVKLLLT